MTVTAVSPTAYDPKHDITLSDGSTTIGIVVTDANGEKYARGIQEYPQERMALKTAQGGGKYDDLQPPYMSIVQDDWSGGRGGEIFEDDKSKFEDSTRMATWHEGKLALGGMEIYGNRATGFSSHLTHNCNYDLIPLSTAFPYAATDFTPDNTFTAKYLQILGIDFDSDSANVNLTVTICNDNSGVPGTTVITETLSLNPDNFIDNQGLIMEFDPTASLSSGTKYWVKLQAGTADRITILGGAAASGSEPKKSADGTNWVAGSYDFYLRVLPAEIPFAPRFFSYKGAQYMVKRFDSAANSFLFLNGDRGAADSNTGALTTLVDATKSWTTNEWANCIVVLVGGPGSEEEIPYRTISSNNATTLTLSATWNVTHTTSTEYVIVKSNKWTSVQDLGGDVTDVAVCNEIVYFARGDNTDSLRYQELNVGGVWTRRTAADAFRANKLQFIQRAERAVLYGSKITDTEFVHSIREQDIPSMWGSITSTPSSLGMWKKRKLVDTNFPWHSRGQAYVVVSKDTNGDMKIAVDGSYTTGILAVQDIEPQTISDCNCFGFYIKSSVATSGNNDLYLVLDDAQDLGRAFGASAVFEYDGTTFTDLAKARDGIYTSNPTEASATLVAATDSLFIGAAEPFNTITFDLDTVNTNAATLTAQYYNGYEFTALTIVTTGVENPAGDPFGKDGNITFTIPVDWEQFTVNGVTGYYVRLLTSADLTAVDFVEVYCQRTNNTAIAIPDLTADVWTWVKLNYVPNNDFAPKEHVITSVGIRLDTDLGAQNIYIRGGIWIGEDQRATTLPVDVNITSLAPYAADGSGIPNLWVFTSRHIYEMQLDNNNAIVKVPIGEVEYLSDHRTGDHWCVSDVYLYFSMKDKIERYYNRNLDDVGIDRTWNGTVWTTYKGGEVAGLLSYPGAVFAAIDATDATDSIDRLSGIYVYKNSGWHNIYTVPWGVDPCDCPRIRGMGMQQIPGSGVSRLWFTQGDDVLWVPVETGYDTIDYDFTWKGSLRTAWMFTGMMEIIKVYKSLKMIAFDLVANNWWAVAEYIVEDDTVWNLIGTFDANFSEEINLDSPLPTGKAIQLRLRLFSTDPIGSPTIRGTVIECFGVVPTKYAWAFNTVLREDFLMVNLQEEHEEALGLNTRAETAYAQLKTWANAATPLTLRSRFSVYDNKTVVINPPASNPIRISSQEQHEEILVNISLLEL